MNRRQFVARGALAAAWAVRATRDSYALSDPVAVGPGDEAARSFSCDDSGLQHVYQAALKVLNGNLTLLSAWANPVLTEGSVYRGVWMECGPQEGLVYADLGTDGARAVARNNHLLFFALQKEDGQLPYSVKASGPGWGQIQMVVPMAATAWELTQRTGDNELLEKAYAACGRWDAWLRRYRNSRKTGLCEGFCTWDTGMDNSPRWSGEPNACLQEDAKICPEGAGLPRLCPDLSAAVYGGRVALAAMARALGKTSEADRWNEDAETIRHLILDRLYDAHDSGFYDLDAQNRFVWVRSDATLRVLGEHVPDAGLFETVWRRQVNNPKVFWAPYPFPSVALDDPQFVRPIPPNSWGGAAQALTALRAPRWMEHYGKSAELAWLMQRWVSAIERDGGFRQQMDPETGVFTRGDPGGYSPAALVFFDFLWRLSGVRAEGDVLEWNVRPPVKGRARFSAKVAGATAELLYAGHGAEMRLSSRTVATVSGVVRVTTTRTGELREAMGISEKPSAITLRVPGKPVRTLPVAPNARVSLT